MMQWIRIEKIVVENYKMIYSYNGVIIILGKKHCKYNTQDEYVNPTGKAYNNEDYFFLHI